MSETKRANVEFGCVVPILNVRNLDLSIDYYLKKLGFKLDWRGGPMASVSRANQQRHAIMFCEAGQGQSGTWVWIGVEDVKPLYEEYLASGATIMQPPTNY